MPVGTTALAMGCASIKLSGETMPKHLKHETHDADLKRNPMIGGSKGTTIGGISADDLQDLQGETTIEGDVGNDTNAQGGIDKAEAQGRTGRNTRTK